MEIAEKDYRIWKNENFVIESTITLSLWDDILINDFHEKLNKVLHEICKKIEKSLGRKKAPKNSPRECDIDILDYANKQTNKGVKLPHPEIIIGTGVPASVGTLVQNANIHYE